MDFPIRPLGATVHDSPDPRPPRGRRHPLVARCAFRCVALRGGDRRDRAMAAWGRGDGQQLGRGVGWTRAQPPGAATWSQGRRHRASPLGDASLGAGAARLLTARPPAPGAPEALAIAGNTRRGSRPHGAPAAPRRAGRRHRWGRTLGPQAGADTTQASPVLEEAWRQVVWAGRVRPVAAWRTPRASAPHRVEGGGDSVRVVKGQPPPRRPARHRRVQDAAAQAEARRAAATVAGGPGRSAQRRLPSRTALGGAHDGPGLAPGCQRERHVPLHARRAQRHAVVDGVTRRSPEPAGPEPWRGGVRLPGQIATPVQGRRAVTCDEDRAHVRGGRMPQVMAACRHTASGFMPWAGAAHSAAACRRCAAQPWSALARLGITPRQ